MGTPGHGDRGSTSSTESHKGRNPAGTTPQLEGLEDVHTGSQARLRKVYNRPFGTHLHSQRTRQSPLQPTSRSTRKLATMHTQVLATLASWVAYWFWLTLSLSTLALGMLFAVSMYLALGSNRLGLATVVTAAGRLLSETIAVVTYQAGYLTGRFAHYLASPVGEHPLGTIWQTRLQATLADGLARVHREVARNRIAVIDMHRAF